jgi:hypothetical protein
MTDAIDARLGPTPDSDFEKELDRSREAAIERSVAEAIEQFAPPDKKSSHRYCWVGAPEIFALEHVSSFVAHCFGEWCCYLVGSATQSRDFRDVDVRLILGDKKWHTLFGAGENGEVLPFWSLVNTAISEYMAKRTGLKIDFQIQSMSQANGEMHGKKRRNPLGAYVDTNAPKWSKLKWNDNKWTL